MHNMKNDVGSSSQLTRNEKITAWSFDSSPDGRKAGQSDKEHKEHGQVMPPRLKWHEKKLHKWRLSFQHSISDLQGLHRHFNIFQRFPGPKNFEIPGLPRIQTMHYPGAIFAHIMPCNTVSNTLYMQILLAAELTIPVNP